MAGAAQTTVERPVCGHREWWHGGTAHREQRLPQRGAVILLDISDESGEDFDELLLERKGAVMWLHFAVRPSGNRRKVRMI